MTQDVVIVAGHYPGPDVLAAPDWRGPLAEFLGVNQGLTLGEVRELRAGLAADGWHQMGGGAAQDFTVYDATAFEALVAALPPEDAPPPI